MAANKKLVLALSKELILAEVMPLMRLMGIEPEPRDMIAASHPTTWSHAGVATKYPGTTRRHFAARCLQAECIKLNGALELAPQLGLCRRIVDIVLTGRTLTTNGVVEVERITQVISRMVVNLTEWKTQPAEIGAWIERFREAVHADAT